MGFRSLTLAALAFGLASVLAGCATMPSNIDAAVADPSRPAADTARDPDRKPAEMLSFAQVKPGELVVDFMPGGGYFTRLFAKAVGPTGKVYAFVPSEVDAIFKKASPVVAIAADPAYSNLTVIDTPLMQFAVPQSVDLVWTSQNYHDLHNKSFGPADMAKLNKAIFNALKPGGIFVVLDHSAQDGTHATTTDTLHRIDEATVIGEVKAAGFTFESESDALRNPNDPRTARVFDPSVRGHTDQFILKFRKPR